MQTITTMAGVTAYTIIGAVLLESGLRTFTNETPGARFVAANITALAAFALWGLWINTTFGG